MKIAILSTPWIAVPPRGYGGIELVVAHLTEGLVARGHEVMLFATGDSRTSARLQYVHNQALGNHLGIKQNPYPFLEHIHGFFDIVRREKFDIIHNNAQYIPQFFCDLQDTPFVHTLHGAFYKELKSPSGMVEDKRAMLTKFKNHAYVSISNQQRTGLPELNYVATVYNSIEGKNFSLGSGKGGYLAWLGRITRAKGVDIAIAVAKRLKRKLKIAAFIDSGDRKYFEEEIKPQLDANVELLDVLTKPEEKSRFLGEAVATLFPIRWHEPFGLVMAESMAVGTPVIALDKGSAPEVVEDGKTGFVVGTEDEMVEAFSKIDTIDRAYCREYALSKFSVDAMVDGYEGVYKKVIARS